MKRLFSAGVLGVSFSLAFAAFGYTSSSYVQDGLIAQWDGIDNAGANDGHDADVTQWIDLKHGYAFDLKNVTIGDSYMSFSGANTSYGVLDATASNLAFPSGTKTVEIVACFDKSGGEQVVLQGQAGCGVAFGWANSDSSAYFFFHNATRSYCAKKTSASVVHGFAMSYDAANAFANRYILDGKSQSLLDKTDHFGCFDGATETAYLGRRATGAGPFKGKIYAIRVYNRTLLSSECEQHLRVDMARFCSKKDFSVQPIPDQTYVAGTPCQPDVGTVRDADPDGGGELVKGEHYDVTYESNEAPGQGIAVITGMEGSAYEGTVLRVPFVIRRDLTKVRTCEWINTDTTTAQPWTEPANWKDIDDDGTGDVPAAGDNVLIAAAANINFADADIGNITHTTGALTIRGGSSSRGTMILEGDFTSSGQSVTIQCVDIFLSAGSHAFDHSCEITLSKFNSNANLNPHISGPGSLVKKGKGTFTYTSDSQSVYLFTGSLTIKGGSFKTQGYGAAQFSGPTEFIMDGGTLTLGYAEQLPAAATLRILNGGTVSLPNKSTKLQRIERMFINGQECAAGIWGTMNSTVATYCTGRLTGNSGHKVIVACCVSTEPYTGATEGWTGETKHWTGVTSTAWGTGSNWQEGVAPEQYDDIVIPAGTPYAPAIPKNQDYWTFHTLTTEQNLATSGWRLTLTGDLHLNGGNFTIYPTITFAKGTHVIDGSGTLTLNWHDSLSYVFGGAGDIIKRGTGTVTTGNTSAPFAHQGFLRVEGGSFKLKNSGDTMPNCTNVTVTGSGSTLQISAARFRADTVLSVADGGVVNLNGAFTNTIGRLYLDDSAMIKGRTYGSKTSGAKKRSDFFLGNGALLPTDGPNPHGLLLFVR